MRLKNTMIALLAFGCITFLSAQEQPSPCTATNDMDAYYAQNPKAKIEHDELTKLAKLKTKTASRGFSARSATSWEIPVVVHVFGETQWGKTVTYDKIKNALNIVNENFQGLNADFTTVDPEFDAIKSSMNVTFKLAKIDPNGGSTNGVVFYEEKTGFGLNGTYYQNMIKEYAWDNYKYMNLYIQADFKNDEVNTHSGIAWLPSTSDSNNKIARAVFNGQYLHDNYANTEFAQLTHEFGHWMGLFHTFNGGCNDANGDYVDDTPKEDITGGDKGCVVGASECGNLINYENYMGYDAASGCSKMFSIGQVTRMETFMEHAARKPLWQAANLTATGVNSTNGAIAIKYGEIIESRLNDGSLPDRDYEITIENATFTMNSGTMSVGTHFTTDLPTGISAAITVVDNTKVNVKFSGQFANHAKSDFINGKSITFTGAAITGGTASVNSAKVSFDFRFFDPYSIRYVDPFVREANTTTVWTPFPIYAGLFYNGRGILYETDKLSLETYKNYVVSEGTTRNITLMQENQLISDDSNWVQGGDYPDLHTAYSTSYTTWAGQTGYIGIQVRSYRGEVNYGWLKAEVNATGTSFKILAYAINLTPSGPIKAGQTTLEATTTPTCDDGLQNGDETGMDCGGTSCNPCQTTVIYCEAGFDGTNYIAEVSFGTISNTSQGSLHSDFTAQSTSVTAGDSVTLTVNPAYTNWGSNVLAGWIDWNQDGDFEDAGEEVLMKAPGTGGGTATFTVPNTAAEGATRLRVRYKWFSNPLPCGGSDFGDEVEDYTVVVGGGTTPAPTCNDGLQNGDETGMDCGGTSCAPCAVAPTCNDGLQNGDETGMDCGGTSCAPCASSGTVVYQDIFENNVDDITLSNTATWNFFRIEVGDDNGFGAWYSGGLRLVNYGKDMITEGTTSNATMLGENAQVGPSSNFTSNSNSFIVSSSSYTAWNGNSGYLGFSFKISGNTHYGWMYVTVAADGLSYTILDYAYNSTAGEGLVTTRSTSKSVTISDNITAYPNPFVDTVSVDVSGVDGNQFTLSVYDITGKVLLQKNYNGNPGQIVLSNEIKNSGSYFIKVQTNTTTQVHRIVKN